MYNEIWTLQWEPTCIICQFTSILTHSTIDTHINLVEIVAHLAN
jgi:hypothetical protein